jgi:hypothetical protein
MSDTKTMNLYEKINKIMGEVESIKKDGKVAFGNTKYNFLSEAKTTEIFKAKFVEYNLVLLPTTVIEDVHVIRSTGKDGNEKVNYLTHGKYSYRLINAENPEEYIDLMSTGQGYDSADKGSGKASSTAYKYLNWRAFAVPSNDDPDNVSSAEHLYDPEKEKEEWTVAEEKLYATYATLGLTAVDAVESKFLERTGKTMTKSKTKEILSEVAKAEKKAKEKK